MEEATWKTLVQATFDRATWVIGHSLPGDLDQMLVNGMNLPSGWITGEKCLDSLLLSRMADENRLSYGLEDLSCTVLGAEPWKSASEAEMSSPGNMLSVSPAVRKERCRLDAWWARRLSEHAIHQLRSALIPRSLVMFTHRTAWTIHRLCLAGAVVDLPEFDRMAEGVLLNTAAVESRLRGEGNTDESFAPSNDHHVRALLYDQLGLDPPGYSKKSGLPSVTKASLAALAPHPLARLLIEFSRWDKLRSTYVAGLSGLIVPAGEGRGWLRWHINPLGTRTGRRSSDSPNSQNWPASVRRIIRSRWSGGQILDADYSRLEPVVLGWLAGDSRFLLAFTKGKGYVDVAKWLFNKTVEEEGKEYKAAKAIVLGTNYGMGVDKLAASLGTSYSEAVRLRSTYFKTFPSLRTYMDDRRAELLASGQVVSPTGRVRRLPVPDGENTPGFGHLLNEAINFPIQSFAADITGSALVDVEAALLSEHNQTLTDHHRKLVEIEKSLTNGYGLGIVESVGLGSLVENEVHDSLVADLHPANPERDTEIIVETMRAVPTLRRLVPAFDAHLNVKTVRGERWGGG